MSATAIERFLPPIPDTVEDWVTVVCVSLFVVLIVSCIVSMFFKQEYVMTILAIAGTIGGIAVGRLSREIPPKIRWRYKR